MAVPGGNLADFSAEILATIREPCVDGVSAEELHAQTSQLSEWVNAEGPASGPREYLDENGGGDGPE
jgi:hypothetical protein